MRLATFEPTVRAGSRFLFKASVEYGYEYELSFPRG